MYGVPLNLIQHPDRQWGHVDTAIDPNEVVGYATLAREYMSAARMDQWGNLVRPDFRLEMVINNEPNHDHLNTLTPEEVREYTEGNSRAALEIMLRNPVQVNSTAISEWSPKELGQTGIWIEAKFDALARRIDDINRMHHLTQQQKDDLIYRMVVGAQINLTVYPDVMANPHDLNLAPSILAQKLSRVRGEIDRAIQARPNLQPYSGWLRPIRIQEFGVSRGNLTDTNLAAQHEAAMANWLREHAAQFVVNPSRTVFYQRYLGPEGDTPQYPAHEGPAEDASGYPFVGAGPDENNFYRLGEAVRGY
jgi:hypothetical protein